MYSISFRNFSLDIYLFLQSFRRTSERLGIAISTLVRWSKCILPKGWPKRSLTQSFTQALKSLIQVTLQQSPWTSRLRLKSLVLETLGATVSIKCISSIIKSLGFSYRRLKRRLTSSRQAQQEKHQEWNLRFRNAFSTAYDAGDLIVAIDESGFDHRMLPLYGYAPKGQPAVVSFPYASDHKRYNLVLAIGSNQEYTHVHSLHQRSVDSTLFADFIRSLPYPKGTILLMDNSAIHKAPPAQQAFLEKGYRPLYTPPYSPALNPVETVFSVIKNAYRTQRASQSKPIIRSLICHALCASVTLNRIATSFRHVRRVISDDLLN